MTLTTREHEVLRLAAKGWTSIRIGRELGISPGTVKVHLKAIRSKTGTHTSGEAVYHVYWREHEHLLDGGAGTGADHDD